MLDGATLRAHKANLKIIEIPIVWSIDVFMAKVTYTHSAMAGVCIRTIMKERSQNNLSLPRQTHITTSYYIIDRSTASEETVV